MFQHNFRLNQLQEIMKTKYDNKKKTLRTFWAFSHVHVLDVIRKCQILTVQRGSSFVTNCDKQVYKYNAACSVTFSKVQRLPILTDYTTDPGTVLFLEDKHILEVKNHTCRFRFGLS